MKIKCALYHTCPGGVKKYNDSELDNKRILVSGPKMNKYINAIGGDDSYPYNYSFDTPIDDEITLGNNQKKNINTVIRFKEDEIDYEYYTYLTRLQRIRLSYNFKNLWFQKSSNRMGLFNILVPIIIAIVTYLLRK